MMSLLHSQFFFFGPEIEKTKNQKNTTKTEPVERERVEINQNLEIESIGQNSNSTKLVRPHVDTNLVYTRRKKAIPESAHVQEFNPIPLQEVNIFEPINPNSTN